MSAKYNPRDYYLLINTETGKIYEKFRNKWLAKRFMEKSPLRDWLELKINPKHL